MVSGGFLHVPEVGPLACSLSVNHPPHQHLTCPATLSVNLVSMLVFPVGNTRLSLSLPSFPFSACCQLGWDRLSTINAAFFPLVKSDLFLFLNQGF